MPVLIILALVTSSAAPAVAPVDIPAVVDPAPILYDVSAHYPRISMERHEEGMATISYLVDAAGIAGHCIVEVSTGFPALDDASCGLIGSALFPTLGRGEGGQTGARRTQRINWRLPR